MFDVEPSRRRRRLRSRRDVRPLIESLEGRIVLDAAGRGAPDFDGDGRADLALYRSSTAEWLIRGPAGEERTQAFGWAGVDRPVPADYDGDGRLDLAVFRPSSDLVPGASHWLVSLSGGGVIAQPFGQADVDIPVPADYDGDGVTDLAVYRPTTSEWFILRSHDGPFMQAFGAPRLDVPVPADYDGDGRADIATFRPSSDLLPGAAHWFLLQSTEGARAIAFGRDAIDEPVPGDYNGDGRVDLAVFRSSSDLVPGAAHWFINPIVETAYPAAFGQGGVDRPVPQDHDGDGMTDLTVYRPPTSQWFILRSQDGPLALTFGEPGAIPVFGPPRAAAPDDDGDDGPVDTTPPEIAFDLARASDTGPVGDRVTFLETVTLLGQTEPGASVILARTGAVVTADAAGAFRFAGVGLEPGENAITLRARDAAGNEGSVTGAITRFEDPGAITLIEGGAFVAETAVPVALGHEGGRRTLSFDLETFVDASDPDAAVEDLLLVYLVDPADPSRTLLDRGTPGTALFALAGDEADFTPGRVRYDGRTVEIDLSPLTGVTEGRLVFQIINSDADEGTNVAIRSVENLVDPDGIAPPVLASRATVAPIGPATDFGELSETTDVSVQVSNVRFDRATGLYTAALRLRNDGPPIARRAVALFPGLPAGVAFRERSGTGPAGVPYIDFRAAIPRGGLGTGALSDAVEVSLANPDLLRFALRPRVLTGGPNRAPSLEPVAPLTVMPGGHLAVPLIASDPDGDEVHFTLDPGGPLPTGLLRGDGTLVLTPSPADLGSYAFTVVASDGVLEARQTVSLTVAPDPVTTTRISGVIADTGQIPLAGMPVELRDASQTIVAQGVTDASGRFVLTCPDGAVCDTLVVRGELFAGDGNAYPFIAEKLPLVLEHEVFEGVDNVIARPVYLPALNPGTDIDPAAGNTVAQTLAPADPAAARVFVAANSLRDQGGGLYDGPLSITEVPRDFTPAALPAELIPDAVVTIQPGEMVFTAPAPLTMPNRAGYAPGTTMDLWSINPETGAFDNVGTGRVNADGTAIETVSGGIRNSSWHFFAINITVSTGAIFDNPRTDAFNHEAGCLSCPVARADSNSVVELHTGAVIETHELATYRSLGAARGLTLTYDSARAHPRPVVHFGLSDVPALGPDWRLVADLTVRRGAFAYQVPGSEPGAFGLGGGRHFWSFGDEGGDLRVALAADLGTLASGRYDYTINVGPLLEGGGRILQDGPRPLRFNGRTQAVGGDLIVVNQAASIFGGGWGLAGLQHLVENPDGSVLLIDGDGSELLFEAPAAADDPFVSPPGDFSTLIRRLGGTFVRTLKDQTAYEFDAGNRLALVRDRNGNETRYVYDGPGRLAQIIDPVGLETSFAYNAAGKVETITDPAGRITRLDYDAAGNLTRVTDPDQTARAWEYDAERRMTAEVNKRGFREETFYDAAGRAVRTVRADGAEQFYDPLQAQVVTAGGATADPRTAPLARPKAEADARHADGDGSVTVTRLDQAGQAVGAVDGAGLLPGVERNAENLVTRSADARGNVTTYEYDARGNVTRIRDRLSSADAGRRDNRGREFWLGFMNNSDFSGVDLSLLISGEVPARGTVEVPGIGFSQDFTVTPGRGATVILPSTVAAQEDGVYLSDVVLDLGVHVTSDAPVSVHGLNARLHSTDGFLGLPVADLGTEYLVMAYQGFGSEFMVVGTVDGTSVTITPATKAGLREVGVPYTVTLDRGEVYQLIGNDDLTGTTVSATAPVAVFGGSTCALIPPDFSACDHLVEQMPPVETWGTNFATMPLADRTGGDTFRILAARDGTEVTINGAAVATLDRGEFHEQIIDGPAIIDTSHPALVAQFANGSEFDVGLGDPFMMMVPPTAHFINRYSISMPASGFTSNFLNVIAPTAALAGLRLNGQAITGVAFTPIGAGDLSGAQVEVNPGAHTLTGPADFGVFVYGFDLTDSYGYPAGRAFAPSTAERRFTYDPAFSQLTSITDELGRRTLFAVDPANGNTLSITEEVGAPGGDDDLITRYTYTPRGLVDTITDPRGVVTDYDYDALGRLITVTLAAGTPDEGVRRFVYDAAGNQVALIDENGRRTASAYDALNRRTRIVEPDPDGPAGPLASPVTSFAYDPAGNLISVTDARNRTTTNAYDARDRLLETVDPDDGTTEFRYGRSGNLLAVTDPLGNTTVNRYDARDRLIATIEPGQAEGTRLAYDPDGNLTALVDPAGNRTDWVYDARDRLIRETDPLGAVTSFRYDLANNIVRRTDRNGRVTLLAYDDLDRLTAETWIEAGGAGIANTVSYAYDRASNLTAVADEFSALAYTYDARDRVRTVDNAGTPDAVRVLLTYAYDPAGNVLSVADEIMNTDEVFTSSAGDVGMNAYAYDALDRVTRITQSGTDVAGKRVDFAYNPLGQFAAIDRYADLTGTQLVAATSYAYDDLNRLATLTHRGADGAAIAFYDYSYDADSRITRIADIDGVTDYSYDIRDQLTGAGRTDHPLFDESFLYDDNGNRLLSRTGPGNRLLSDGFYDYEYDDEGNLIRRVDRFTEAVRTFAWDHRNRLTAVIDRDPGGVETFHVEYTYDALGRRISRDVLAASADTLNATVRRYVYDGDDVLLEFAHSEPPSFGPRSSALAVRNLHGPAVDQILAREGGTGYVLWHLADHLGSVRDLVEDSGRVASHIAYDSFGNPVTLSGPINSTRYLFTGREYDYDTGLYDYRARYYDAAIGAFISEDPSGFDGGDPNLYRYVGNSPVIFSDPDGLRAVNRLRRTKKGVEFILDEVIGFASGGGAKRSLSELARLIDKEKFQRLYKGLEAIEKIDGLEERKRRRKEFIDEIIRNDPKINPLCPAIANNLEQKLNIFDEADSFLFTIFD